MLKVTEETVSGWESGKYHPKTSYIARIISFLGYSPISYGNDLKQYRKGQGLTAYKLARMLKVDTRTIAKFEAGKTIREDVARKIKTDYLKLSQ